MFNYYFECGNTSNRVPTEVFNYYFLCGNTSNRNPTEIFNYYFVCGNVSEERTPREIFNYYFECGNTSNRIPTEIFNYYFNCGNTSNRQPTNVFNYWFNCSNVSETRTPTQIFNYWFNCSNVTHGRQPTQVFNYYFVCGNVTLEYLNITNEYPTNNSVMIPMQPIVYATITSTLGNTMNMTIYYNGILLANHTNVTDGTYSATFYQANTRSTSYTWYIILNDGTNTLNHTYNFKTEGYSGGYTYTPNTGGSLWIIGLFGMIGFVLILYVYKKRREN